MNALFEYVTLNDTFVVSYVFSFLDDQNFLLEHVFKCYRYCEDVSANEKKVFINLDMI